MCDHIKVFEVEYTLDEYAAHFGYDGEVTPEELAEIHENMTPYCVTLSQRCDDCGDTFGDDTLCAVWAPTAEAAITDALMQLSIDGVQVSSDDLSAIVEA